MQVFIPPNGSSRLASLTLKLSLPAAARHGFTEQVYCVVVFVVLRSVDRQSQTNDEHVRSVVRCMACPFRTGGNRPDTAM